MEVITVIYAIVCITTCLVSVCLLSGLIYYEVNINDRYKTLTNQIYSLLLAYLIIFIIAINILTVGQVLYGPLPDHWCHFICSITLGSAVSLCLGLNESIYIKYLYCCVYKSIGCLNDDICFYFIARINIMLALYISIFLQVADMGPVPLFIYCTGCNQLQFTRRIYQSEIPYPVYIAWTTLLFHIILKYKIYKTQITLESLTDFTGKPSYQRRAIFSSWINIFILLLFGLAGSYFMINLGKQEKNAFSEYLSRPLSNIALGCAIPSYSYYNHANIRNFVLKTLTQK